MTAKHFIWPGFCVDICGPGYSGHPRLESLLKLNKISPLNFLSGAGEAEAFETNIRRPTPIDIEQGRRHQQPISARARPTVEDLTTFWEMRGGTFRGIVSWLSENKVLALILAILGVLLSVATFKFG
jgi:hypothetical protein